MASEINAVHEACRLFFGEQTPVSAAFFDYMQLAGLKDTYRTLAKANHPDRAQVLGGTPDELSDRFNAIRSAYEILLPYVTGQKALAGVPVPAPKKTGQTGARARESSSNHSSFHTGSLKDRFWSGQVPERVLRFGQYLYYSRDIGWNMLVSALVWQRSNRPKLGELALERGFLSAREVLEIRRAASFGELWGETGVRLGILELNELETLLMSQRLQGCQIGQYFVRHGVLCNRGLIKKLSAQWMHNQQHLTKPAAAG